MTKNNFWFPLEITFEIKQKKYNSQNITCSKKSKMKLKFIKKTSKMDDKQKKSKNRVAIWRQSEGAASIRQKLGN